MRIKSVPGLISCFLILIALIVAEPMCVYSATISDLEKEKAQIEKQKEEALKQQKAEQSALDAADKAAEAIEGDLEDVGAEIDEIDSNIIETMASVEMMEEDIKSLEEQIDTTNREYEEAKKTEEEQYESMKLRIKYMYEKGNYTYMELLFEAQSFSDMVNKAEYVEKLYDYDRKLLIRYEEAKNRTFELKEELEDEKAEMDASLFELQQEKDYLDGVLEKKKEEYHNFEDKLKEAQQEVMLYKARVTNQNKLISRLEKEGKDKDKQIADAKKAEEEAKRAAEEALRKQQEAEKEATAKNGKTSEGGNKSKQYAGANSFTDGSKGQQIVNYAMQFIGNPYVYGGTSLTKGCDCSGFIYRIYSDFGISIPRPGISMRTIGQEVSYENARAGDIICYAGHVALYMGGGMIVHASTARTGIRTGNALYKPIITIRRIV